jgi:5-methyltetrahydrofolate--homocysteine methyltransferase
MLKILYMFEKITSWWDGKPIESFCYGFSLHKPTFSRTYLNKYWASPDVEPDYEGLVNGLMEHFVKSNDYFGEALPVFPHLFGGRGTPMIMAAYLGGKVKFCEESVWIDPIIDDWEKFDIRFDENNIWLNRSIELFKLSVEKSNEKCVPCLPDFGDALTVLSLLRGADRFLVDLIENKEAVLNAVNKFINLWPKFHNIFWKIYSKKFSGDNSWLIWAPGKTYGCQCDVSTMISPQMFIDFVVPEIKALGKYLDYMIWHLDGKEEFKHLDILLDMPEIKAIQWVPGAGNPNASHPKWLPMFKKVQAKNRGLVLYVDKEEEVKSLMENLSLNKLLILNGFTGKTKQEAMLHLGSIIKFSKIGGQNA